MKLLTRILILTSGLLLASCGYFSDEPVTDAGTYKSDKLANSCQIDVEKLSKIIEEDVQAQIDCLEENLLNFTKYVKRDDASSVSDQELSGFIRRFFKGHAQIILDSLGLIFDINSLFLRDSTDTISTQNIGPLFDLLRVANLKLAKLVTTLRYFEEDKIDMESAQILFESDLRDFSLKVKNIISRHGRGNDSSINLEEFFNRISTQFETFNLSKESLNGLMALKKLFMGGQREILTRSQLFVFLDRLPELGSISFSLLYASKANQGSNAGLYSLFKRNIEVLTQQVYPHRREEIIFKEGEIEGLIESFFAEDKELFVEVSHKVKKHLLGSRTEVGPYSYQEIRNISHLTLSMLEGLVFYEKYNDSVTDNKSWNKNNWNWKKEQFVKNFNDFQSYLTTALNQNTYFPESVEIFAFSKYLASKFESFPIKENLLDTLPLLKVVLVGGPKVTFNKLELLNILNKSNSLANVSFDLIYSSKETHSDQDMAKLYYQAVKEVRQLVTPQKYLHVTTVEELLTVLSNTLNKPALIAYQPTVEDLKEKIFGGYAHSITVADIAEALEMAEGFLGRYFYFDLSYDAYRDILETPVALRHLNYRHHKNYSLFTQDEILTYKNEFNDLVSRFRVFRNDDGTQFYGDTYKRSKKGVLEIFMIKYASTIITNAYGHKIIEKNMHALNEKELRDVLFIFKPVLEDYGLWSVYPENFARNALFLSDLFQGQSDGNLSMDPNEAAEYGTLALFAIKAANDLVSELKNRCEWIQVKEVEGFSLSCYRSEFFDVILNELNLREQLPKLAKYIDESSAEEKLNFLTAVEGFARESQDQERPETQKDLVLLLGAMLNIESTFLRYDKNQNNIIDPEELDKAFPVYKDAIIKVAKLDESKSDYAQTIFLYMIKYMEEPSKFDILKFDWNIFVSKRISSKRLNIGALLYNMLLASQRAKTVKTP
ncbi:MAG: hypothetical protein K9K67_04695 [Bacteriovoracaceae bacterium]|nr:hypothetical protein [Bacteriovoracaceae bacterium]